MQLTSNKSLLWHSSNDKFDDVSSVFDDGDGVRVQHSLCAVTIDLKQLISNLHTEFKDTTYQCINLDSYPNP